VKRKSKETKSETPKVEEKAMKLSIALTNFQFQVISLLNFIITGTSRMDQLSDVLYHSLLLIRDSGIRPFHFNLRCFNALSRWESVSGETCGTCLSGKGAQGFIRYQEYLDDLFGDDNFHRHLNQGDLLIAILMCRVTMDANMLSKLYESVEYFACLMIVKGRTDTIQLRFARTLAVDEFHWMDYDIKEIRNSVYLQELDRILAFKSSFILDAYEKVDHGISKFANSVILRLQSMVESKSKAGKLSRPRWRIHMSFRSDGI
jgi:hypothetical protein